MKPVHTAQAIVVLGARVLPGGEPGSALRARVERAVALFHEGLAPLLVLSGGVGAHPPSEAQVMREVATALGVPEEACVLEERSRSTRENARYTSELLRARGITDVVVVSDAYHLFRARRSFRLEGFEVRTVAAALDGRNVSLVDRARWTIREALAIACRPSLLWARRPRAPR